MANRIPDVHGGPGWAISGANLRPFITDVELFRKALREDPLARPLEQLWFGKAYEAEELLLVQKPTFRTCVLLGECKVYQGQAGKGVQIFLNLLVDNLGELREPTLRQHLGKAYLVLGKYDEALAQFEQALNLRELQDAPADLIASSKQAIHFTQQKIAKAEEVTAHLLDSPTNARRLLDSIGELENAQGCSQE